MDKQKERKLVCKRCAYDWTPRVDGRPRTCPRCKSPRWDEAKHMAKTRSHILEKRGTSKEYIAEIDAFYNYGAKGKRVPLAFRADEMARLRQKHPCNK